MEASLGLHCISLAWEGGVPIRSRFIAWTRTHRASGTGVVQMALYYYFFNPYDRYIALNSVFRHVLPRGPRDCYICNG
jgi:hypothetical protein